MLRRGDVSQRSPYGTGLGRKRTAILCSDPTGYFEGGLSNASGRWIFGLLHSTFSPEEDEKNILMVFAAFPVCTFVKSRVKRAFAAESRMLH